MRFTAHAALLLAAALLSSCAGYDRRLNDTRTSYLGTDGSIISRSSQSTLADKNSYWDGEGVTGSPFIVIDLSEQTASFYRGGKLVGVSAISSGREGFGTPTGNYKITQKKPDHVSNLYGNYVNAQGDVLVKNVGIKKDPKPPGAIFAGSPMPYFMRLNRTAVGLHQGFLPGVPDSHGCIRLPERMAKVFFDNAPIGTPVRIIN
ncbi:MAG: L,D-transpeptidase [Verrucomicrobia bacterium]|jgi:lipoprotein-anchoring transpeptidase ErfK/SrfK|nr:L,D-transpeptidase [Verrucomicrobiota bacterium]